MSLWTGGILWCFTEKLQSFVHSQHSVPPIIQAKTKDAKPLMHKSTHSRQKDYVYHSIRDATLSGIMRSETPVSAGVCVFWLAVSRIRAARPHNTCWRPWALGTIQRLKSSRIRARDVQRQNHLTVKQWNFWCLLGFSSSKILLFANTSKQSRYTNHCHFGVVFFIWLGAVLCCWQL